jgi:hypothetical protein
MILGASNTGSGSGTSQIRAQLSELRCARTVLDHRPHGPYVRPGDSQDYWCPGGPPDVLTMVGVASGRLAAARKDLDEVVLAARQSGASYAAIGAVLGVSRQAAWERFHKLEEQAS